MEGFVIKTTGSWYKVLCAEGQSYDCRLRGSFRMKGNKSTNPIAVGDRVSFIVETSDNTGVITEIKDRKNCIVRRSTKLSKQTHVIAANIDQNCLVVTLGFPRTSTGFIDRILVTSEAYHIPAVIIFNKIDLYNDELWEYHNEIKGMYEKVGYRCLEISARENRNIDQVRELVKDKTTLFTGHSGVGKSALINAIDPELKLRVGDVSEWSMKGKHTTTFAEIFPFAQGGYIIDTPGIKEFGMVNFSKEEISHFFPEMRNVLHGCRFANCTHEHEPSCAVKQAVADGIIDEVRYQNYINILNGREMELEDWETR